MRKMFSKKSDYAMHIFYEPMYSVRVDLQIGKHVDLAKIYAIKNPMMSQSGKAGKTLTISNDKGETKYIVWIADKKDLTTLAHECVHLTNQIFKDAGVKIDVDNDETQAYYVSYWFAELRKKL